MYRQSIITISVVLSAIGFPVKTDIEYPIIDSYPIKTLEVIKAIEKVDIPKAESLEKKATNIINNGDCDLMTDQLSKYLSGEELKAAVKLGQLESGCRSQIANPSSGACNYFQELPCGKWGGTSNTEAHIQGAISYCRARYGNFQNALVIWHSRNPHWW